MRHVMEGKIPDGGVIRYIDVIIPAGEAVVQRGQESDEGEARNDGAVEDPSLIGSRRFTESGIFNFGHNLHRVDNGTGHQHPK